MAETATVATVGWKASARKIRVGEKVSLTTIEGDFWIRPQKLNVERSAELRDLQLESAKKASPETRRIIRTKIEEWSKLNPEEDRSPGMSELQSMLTDDEWDKITDIMALKGLDVQQTRLLLEHGVAESNFTDEKGNPIAWSAELAAQIMDFTPVANEIAVIVQRWNAPLPAGSGGSS